MGRAVEFSNDPVVLRLEKNLLEALELAQPASKVFLEGLMQAFRARGADVCDDAPLSEQPPSGALAPWQLRRARELIEAGLETELRMPDVARACGLSSSQFSRAFRNSTGVPPHRWLMLRRLDRCRQLMLSSNASLADIALACGFADQSHLHRWFTRQFGATPGVWRRAHGTAPDATVLA